MKRIILAGLATLMFAQPALAAGGCYNLDAASAEAAVRIHSKLMVIALTCKYAPDGSSLTDAYVSFGRKYTRELRQAENTLIQYYKANGKPGVAELDRLRTILGNEYANEVAVADPHEFCKTAASIVTNANMWNAPQFQQAIATQIAMQTTTGVMRLCPTTPAVVDSASAGGAYGVITTIKTGADVKAPE